MKSKFVKVWERLEEGAEFRLSSGHKVTLAHREDTGEPFIGFVMDRKRGDGPWEEVVLAGLGGLDVNLLLREIEALSEEEVDQFVMTTVDLNRLMDRKR